MLLQYPFVMGLGQGEPPGIHVPFVHAHGLLPHGHRHPARRRGVDGHVVAPAAWPGPLPPHTVEPGHPARAAKAAAPGDVPAPAWRALEVLGDEEAYLAGTCDAGGAGSSIVFRERAILEDDGGIEARDAVMGTRFRLHGLPPPERERSGHC